jgi:hypothetical protein
MVDNANPMTSRILSPINQVLDESMQAPSYKGFVTTGHAYPTCYYILVVLKTINGRFQKFLITNGTVIKCSTGLTGSEH